MNCSFSSINVGFYWENGVFTSLNDVVTGEAKPYGVNVLGQIVGHFYPYPGVPGPEQGFIFTRSSGTAVPLNAPNATTTLPKGINDAGQISGTWADASGKAHGFFYDNGTWISFDHSGTNNTTVVGINGIGQTAGFYYTSRGTHGFVYSKIDGWTNIDWCWRAEHVGDRYQ